MVRGGGFVDWSSLINWSSMSVSLLGLWWVDRGTLISNLSNKSVVVVSSVGGGLDSTIRKSNHEGSSNFAFSILSFSLLEVVLGVVINDSIFIGKWLRGELLLLVDRSWVVGSRGSIGWGASSKSSGEEGRGNYKLVHCSRV